MEDVKPTSAREAHRNELRCGLNSRHIQLTALGGTIGTGRVLSVGQAIQMAGPLAMFRYAVASLIAFLNLRQFGELVVDEPVAGPFGYFANMSCNQMSGSCRVGTYWMVYILLRMTELSTLGIWPPAIPTGISALAFFVLVNAFSLLNVYLRRTGILVLDRQRRSRGQHGHGRKHHRINLFRNAALPLLLLSRS